MIRRALFIIPILALVAPAFVPSVSACSLALAGGFERFQWIGDDEFLTTHWGGVGIFNTTRDNYTTSLNVLMVRYAVASPDGEWLMVAYWDGYLGADCSHPIEATDVFSTETYERVPLINGTAHVIAGNERGVAVFGAEPHAILFYEWGAWSDVTRLDFEFPTRPDLKTSQVTYAALSEDLEYVAFMADRRVYVANLTLGDVIHDAPYPVAAGPMANPFAFEPDGKRLAFVASDDSSVIRILSLEGDKVRLIASRSEPGDASGFPFTGGPTWGPLGIGVPFTHGVRFFEDASDLHEMEEWRYQGDGAPYFTGAPTWHPDGSRLVVGGYFVAEEGPSTAAFWILDGKTRDVLEHHRSTPYNMAEPSPWRGMLNPEDYPPREGPKRNADNLVEEWFAPAPGVLLVVPILVALVLVRRGTEKKTR